MIRVSASCDDISDSVNGTVGKVQETSGRHIKRVRHVDPFRHRY